MSLLKGWDLKSIAINDHVRAWKAKETPEDGLIRGRSCLSEDATTGLAHAYCGFPLGGAETARARHRLSPTPLADPHRYASVAKGL